MVETQIAFDFAKIRENVEKVIAVAEQLLDKREEIAAKRNDIEHINIEKFFQNIEEKRPQTDAFFSVLDSFEKQDLFAVLTVMYAGRDLELIKSADRFVPFEEFYYTFFIDDTSAMTGAKMTLYEKHDLIDYLRAGMRYYGI